MNGPVSPHQEMPKFMSDRESAAAFEGFSVDQNYAGASVVAGD
jgi:hypothetical protein